LNNAEKAIYQGNLKLSSIKFDQDEMGSPVKPTDKLNQTLNPTLDYSPVKTDPMSKDRSIFNKKQSTVTNMADHQSGEIMSGTRS